MNIIEEYARPIDKESIKGIPSEVLLSMYKKMVEIRSVEERIGELVAKGEIKTPCHLYIGEEAVATGVCSNLKKTDFVFSTHRSHGHYLAKGGDLKKFIAEIFGRASGCSKGRGGSMHIASSEVGLAGSSAIVGGSIPLAVGAALGFSLKGKKNITVAFFGDGATNEGVFYESLNFASLMKLPVIFVCENNFYSTHINISKIQAIKKLYKIGKLYEIPSFQINGNNIIEVFKTTQKAIEKARKKQGPSFIEAQTYRWRGHVGPNWDLDKSIRSREEVFWWVNNNCPIKKFEILLTEIGLITEKTKKHIYKEIKNAIDESILFAKKSPFPNEKNIEKLVFKE